MSMREQKRTYASHHTSKKSSPYFKWRSCDGTNFQESILKAYNKIVHWHCNLFQIPSEKAWKLVVKELTHLFEAYAEATTLDSVAITAATVLPSLILQKPHCSSKKKEHIKCIERCMQLWKDGNLDDLLKEGQTIQQHLHKPTRDQRSEKQLARSFSKLRMEGKVRAALRLIAQQEGDAPMEIDQTASRDSNGTTQTVLDILKLKHPEGKPVRAPVIDGSANSISQEEPHPVIFERITGSLIRTMVLRTEGAAGPSGLDAQGWRRLCIPHSKKTQLASAPWPTCAKEYAPRI